MAYTYYTRDLEKTYKNWKFADLEVTDDLHLTGSASNGPSRFEFRVDLARFVENPNAKVTMARGLCDDAYRLVIEFVTDELLGAIASANATARDRLNDFINDELGCGREGR